MLKHLTICCFLCLSAATFSAHAKNPAAFPPLFGTQETPSTDLTPFPKWTGTLERYLAEPPGDEAACDTAGLTSCHLREWNDELETLASRPRQAQLDAINQFINHADYIFDIINWGIQDYWATPQEFFFRDGDCEDYAIAKFMSLRALGFSNDSLRIIVLHDLNLNILHAVLGVNVDGKIYILDNQLQNVVPASSIAHYQPIYSINETGWWRHIAPNATSQRNY